MPAITRVPKTGARPKTKTIERAKYKGPAGEGLFIRLILTDRKTGDPYHVKWTRAETVSGLSLKGSASGVAATAKDEDAGLSAFHAARNGAAELEWESIPIAGRGSPRLELQPIPAPRKKPGRKPKGSPTN